MSEPHSPSPQLPACQQLRRCRLFERRPRALTSAPAKLPPAGDPAKDEFPPLSPLSLRLLETTVFAQPLSCVQLFAIPWTIAHQAPLSMEFSRQEYLARLPFPSPGDLPDPRMEPKSPVWVGRFFTIVPAGKS